VSLRLLSVIGRSFPLFSGFDDDEDVIMHRHCPAAELPGCVGLVGLQAGSWGWRQWVFFAAGVFLKLAAGFLRAAPLLHR